MTGVPGGDVTLHAAITAELDLHQPCPCGCGDCIGHPSEDDDSPRWRPSHAAERIMAVLADRLPHTPPDQLATLIGGDWETAYSDPTLSRAIGPWVPDSPPAAPEPRQDTCPGRVHVYDATPICGDTQFHAPHPLPAAPTEEPNRA